MTTVEMLFYAVATGCLLVQMIFYWGVFARFVFARKSAKTSTGVLRVSVVVCAKNNALYLRKFLPLILNQDYPDFEVVVVNDNSDDSTEGLLREMQQQYKQLQVVAISTSFTASDKKKLALAVGIRSAKNEWVLITDVDCCPNSPHWISEMTAAYSPEKQIVLGYGSYKIQTGVLDKLLRFDTLHTAVQYFSLALAGYPYRGTGRNVLYRKDLFLSNQNYLSLYRALSENDDLFINQVADKHNTATACQPDAHTLAEQSHLSFSKWMIQLKDRSRTKKYYKMKNKFILKMYGASGFLFYLTFFLSLVCLWRNWFALALFAGAFCLRLLSQWIIFGKACNKLNEKKLIGKIPLMDLFFTFFMPLVLSVLVVKKQKRWK